VIARVVDFVDASRKGLKDVDPPAMLKLGFMCEDGKLPLNGGVYEQDAATMFQMRACLAVHDTLVYYRNLKGKEIHNLTNGQRSLLRVLKEQGLFTG